MQLGAHTIVVAVLALVTGWGPSVGDAPGDLDRHPTQRLPSKKRAVAVAGKLAWQELEARPGDELHYNIHFEDQDSLWRCEGRRCQIRYGANVGRQVETPCDAYRYPTMFSSPSKSGRWLLQSCDGKAFVVDMETGRTRKLPVDATRVHAGIVDDAGTATLASRTSLFFRVPRRGKPKRFSVTPPKEALDQDADASLVPGHGPWIGFSDGAYEDEVGWRVGRPARSVRLGGGAFFNGEHVWVSLMTGGYVQLRADGKQDAVTGRLGGGLPGKGLLMSIVPWGERGLIVEYEKAISLVDDQLETVREVALPKVEGMLDIGSNPQGDQIHLASPYGALYLLLLPAEVVERASPPS